VCTGTTGLETLTTTSILGEDDLATARQCVARARPAQRSGVAALPLRVGDHVFGAVVLGVGATLDAEQLQTAQVQTDEQAIRLETALLVEDVRSLATTEERNRVARDIHDGVAQRIVSLGYLVDDVAALCDDPASRQGAEDLRNEVTRLISELRFSVFDLRHDVGEAGSLSGALSEYVRELSTHSNLRVHLTLDERGVRLTRRHESELLRIAQEAVGNVHKHARAINVWVSLTVNGTDVRLVVEDDGIGGASPRTGHYGLHTMRERAERIGADLEVCPRRDGGTVVALVSRPVATDRKGADTNDHHHLARR
jgi:signal transduction histidine kinase